MYSVSWTSQYHCTGIVQHFCVVCIFFLNTRCFTKICFVMFLMCIEISNIGLAAGLVSTDKDCRTLYRHRLRRGSLLSRSTNIHKSFLHIFLIYLYIHLFFTFLKHSRIQSVLFYTIWVCIKYIYIYILYMFNIQSSLG